MVNLTIDGQAIVAEEGQTLLDAARNNGILVPTLCHFKGLHEIGACRICVVEVQGCERLVTACNTPVAEGMVVETRSARVMRARRNNLALILSEHDCHCPTCVRNGNCALQTLAQNLNVLEQPFAVKLPRNVESGASPLVRTASKCVSCLRCVSVCEKIQGMNVWDLLGLGKQAHVGVRGGQTLTAAHCTYCGQCITHCPTGALRARDDTMRLMEAVHDPQKVVVMQVAPAVRAAWGDALGLSDAMATERRMAAVFRRIGVDYVFDTNFAADLTIMEEGHEFLSRLRDADRFKRPMFTSCCPGWVRFMKLEFPDMVGQLSSAKSPQQMFGAVTKTYFARQIGKDAKDVFCVSVMPCTAKKYECDVEAVNDAGAGKDVDLVLTTREVGRLVRALGINVGLVPEEDFDSPLGTGSGAGVIFGATGGVMEAALRTVYAVVTGKNPDADAFKVVRGSQGRREMTVRLGETDVRACVVSGLANARQVVEDIRAGRVVYDFVEVMACPGGCAGGGGQPIFDGCEMASLRASSLYALDAANHLRFSHENPSVQKVYAEDLGAPLSERAHALLHTDQAQWQL